MIAGFAVRLAGAYDTENLAYVIASTVLIMSGPPVYALINYRTLLSLKAGPNISFRRLLKLHQIRDLIYL
jgi:hypothetical protein